MTNEYIEKQNLYDNKQSHPIIEYKPSKEEVNSGTLTPSFVLDVTWPRLIQFYHPASSHCISFQSTYIDLARGIKRRSSRLPIEFHAVNCGIHREVCEISFNVKSVPTLVGLKSGMIEWNEIILPDRLDNSETIQFIANELGITLDTVGGHAGGAYARPVSSDGITPDFHLQESHTRAKSKSPRLLEKGGNKSDPLMPLSEQVFHDASSSFFITITSSLYSQFPHNSALPAQASITLHEFIDLIRWAYPPETKLHDLAENLSNEFFSISTSEKSLLNVVGRHMNLEESVSWSQRCSGGSNQSKDSYSCGMWSLLHILSLGVAERHDAVVGDMSRVSVQYAGHVIRSFIERFFIGCDSCRKLWLHLYDDACCELHNSDHSIADTAKHVEEIVESSDWRQLAFWIWRIHNEINFHAIHSSTEGYHNKYSQMAQSSVLWPSKENCPKCWQSSLQGGNHLMNKNSYNQEEIYNHLKQTYWQPGMHNNRHILLDKWTESKRMLSMQHLKDQMESHGIWTANFLIIMIIFAYIACSLLRLWLPFMKKVRYFVECLRQLDSWGHTKRQKKRYDMEDSVNLSEISNVTQRFKSITSQRRSKHVLKANKTAEFQQGTIRMKY